MNYKQNNKGFSLIEILLVLLIIGFVVMLIFNLPPSINLIGSSRYNSLAKDIASKKIEDLRARGYENLASGAFSDNGLNSLPSGFGEVVVEDCPVSICTNTEEVKQVTVKVKWLEGSEEETVELLTMIGEGGIK